MPRQPNSSMDPPEHEHEAHGRQRLSQRLEGKLVGRQVALERRADDEEQWKWIGNSNGMFLGPPRRIRPPP